MQALNVMATNTSLNKPYDPSVDLKKDQANKIEAQMVSLPKSGTTMLQTILKKMGLDARSYKRKYLHFWQMKKIFQKDCPVQKMFKGDTKVICLFRDPRDNVVSFLNYIDLVEKKPELDPMLIKSFNYQTWHPLTRDEKLTELIKGERTSWKKFTVPTMNAIIKLQNVKMSNVMLVKFEDIVGERSGGSSLAKQKDVFRNIYKFYSPSTSMKKVNKRVDSALKEYFSVSLTYNPKEKQKVGQWKRYFNAEHIQYFKENYNYILTKLGYEKDLNWGNDSDNT